ELVSAPYSNVGLPLVELAETVGRAASAISLARLLAAAATRFPEDADLVRRAESRARAAGDRALVQVVRLAMPVDARVNGLIDHADTASAAGDAAAAIEALEDARAAERLPDELRPQITERLRHLYRDQKRFDVLQALLRDEMERETALEARIALGRELASVLTDTGHANEATAVISGLLESSPKRPSLY